MPFSGKETQKSPKSLIITAPTPKAVCDFRKVLRMETETVRMEIKSVRTETKGVRT